ncbi:MAG: dephospho-CoA kinase [candidate division WOR-3 bacterium]
MKLLVGITGNISSGKSTFCELLKEKGVFIIDADKIGHKIIEEKKEKIKKIFGDYLGRREIAEIIFKDEEKKREYERWIHREIMREVKKIINEGKEGYYFVEGALIFEAGVDKFMDFVIFLKAREEVLIERAKKKGISEDMIRKIIESQNKLKDKEERANFVIENENDIFELKKKAEEIFIKIKNFTPKFLCDSTCLRESRWLRLLGFDTVNAKFLKDFKKGIFEEKRFLLTRKKGGYLFPEWKIFKVPEGKFNIRMKRIIDFFGLKDKISIFSRCPLCNNPIEEIEKSKVKNRVPYYTYKTQEKFYICSNCEKIYWKGSHYFYFENHIKDLIK